MSQAKVHSNFPVEKDQASARLFFAKENVFSTVWHIVDAMTGIEGSNGKVESFIALHGKRIHVAVQADTVLQCELMRGASETFCARCLEEFELAGEVINSRDLLKFK